MLQGRLEASRLGIGSRDGVREERAALSPSCCPVGGGKAWGLGVSCSGSVARVQEETKHDEFLHVDGGRVVASLDRKRLGAEFWGGAESRSQAFSIRRLEGSRWRLR